MASHEVVLHDQWIEARKQLLANEKEFTRLRDQLSQQRRDLPWQAVDKRYLFDGPDGTETLADLFGGSSQLIVHHFMFDPSWDAGCKSCSSWAHSYSGTDIHLRHRDITFVAVSRAPSAKLAAYKQRMGWSFKWVSSSGSDFNYDYYGSFTPVQIERETAFMNYRSGKAWGEEVAGISVFYRDDRGRIFHTYSTYARKCRHAERRLPLHRSLAARAPRDSDSVLGSSARRVRGPDVHRPCQQRAPALDQRESR